MKLFKRSFHYALGMLALAVGTLLPSCTQESFIESHEDEGVEMVIHVGDETRTTNNGAGTLWEEDDELTVIHSAPGGSEFWASRFTKNAGENSFTGKVKRLSATNDWYVVYPFREDNVAADQLSFTFPANQTQAGNASMAHLAGESFPLVAKSLNLARGTQLNVKMQNVLHVLEFDFENKTESAHPIVVKEVQFTATSAIAGSFNVDLTGDNPVVTAGSGATKVVTLAVTDGAPISANGTSTFYMAIAPFTAPAGSALKVKVTATDTETNSTVIFYRTITAGENGITFSSGLIQPIGVEFDENHSQNPDAGSGTEVELPVGGEPEDGVYLLVYENGANSYAFAAFDEYKSQHYAIPVVVENGVVLPQDGIDLARFAVELENTGEEHPNDEGHDAYNVRNSDGKYVFYATAGGTYEAEDALHIMDINEMEVQGDIYKYYHTFEQTTDGVRIVCSIATGGNKYLFSYTATDGFNYQQDNASGTNLHLFLLGEGSAKERQELVFTPDTVTYNYDNGGDFPEPELSGLKTTISSWESSNTDVATVDENGNVTIHGPGSAVITVTADANEAYYGATGTYTIESTSANVQIWYKADEMVADKQYLIVSNGYALQNNSGSLAATAVTVSSDIITMNAPAGIIWTADASNQLKNNNQYLTATSSGSWNASYTLSIGNSATAWTYDADNDYLTFSASSTWGGSSKYYLYYSTSNNGGFTISTSESSSHIAALYSTTKPLTPQNLSFADDSVIKIWGEDCTEGTQFPVQTVTNAQTSVTYTSSKTSVATINGTTITVVGKGSTIITATAKEENGYKSATATYTLRINNPAPAGFKSLGTFNLENDHVKAYLTEAAEKYTDDNYTTANGGSGTSIVTTHTSGESETNRWDIPNPVKLEWDDASTGTTTITVYNDQALTDEVWTWTTTTNNIKSYDVYNLIPGRTYFCTVVDDTGAYLLKGTFDTEGRRRMIKVSDKTGANYANNCRDLGGLETVDGHRIKYGMIYRGTNLTGTSIEERAYLVNFMNIGLDNDLRSGSGGGSNRDDPFHTTTGGHVNYGTAVDYHGPGYSADLNSLKVKASVYETMQAFIDCAKKDKASYFHCYIGSDRTGYWGLLIEGLLGVSPKDCSIDFELTGFAKHATGGDRPRNTSSYLYFTGMNDFKKMTYYTDPDTTDPYYTTNKLQYTITKYLIKDVGISWEDIQAFKEKVLE